MQSKGELCKQDIGQGIDIQDTKITQETKNKKKKRNSNPIKETSYDF